MACGGLLIFAGLCSCKSSVPAFRRLARSRSLTAPVARSSAPTSMDFPAPVFTPMFTCAFQCSIVPHARCHPCQGTMVAKNSHRDMRRGRLRVPCDSLCQSQVRNKGHAKRVEGRVRQGPLTSAKNTSNPEHSTCFRQTCFCSGLCLCLLLTCTEYALRPKLFRPDSGLAISC